MSAPTHLLKSIGFRLLPLDNLVVVLCCLFAAVTCGYLSFDSRYSYN